MIRLNAGHNRRLLMIWKYSKFDIISLVIFVLAYYLSIKLKHPAIVFLVVLLIFAKYLFIDLKRYKKGMEIRGVIKTQIEFLDKVGGKGFGIGFIYFLYILAVIVFFVAVIFSIFM